MKRAYIVFYDDQKNVLVPFGFRNLYTGFGGKKEDVDKTIADTAVRECLEEMFNWTTEHAYFQENLRSSEHEHKCERSSNMEMNINCPAIGRNCLYEIALTTNLFNARELGSKHVVNFQLKRPKDEFMQIAHDALQLQLQRPLRYYTTDTDTYTYFVTIDKLNNMLKRIYEKVKQENKINATTAVYNIFPKNINELVHCRITPSNLKFSIDTNVLYIDPEVQFIDLLTFDQWSTLIGNEHLFDKWIRKDLTELARFKSWNLP